MKKFKVFTLVLVLTWMISTLVVAPASAAGLKGTEFDLVNEKSGFKALIPNFIKIADADADVDGEMVTVKNVIHMETPVADANGNYPIYEVVTTNKNAFLLDSYPGDMMGQLGNFEGNFKNGSLTYSPRFFIGRPLSEITQDSIFSLNFNVYDKDYNFIFSVTDLRFKFVNKKQTAKVSASKVLVDGKETAFEAYNIADSNYFKLRDLAQVLSGTDKQFEVGYDAENSAIALTKGKAYTSNGTELVLSKSPKDKPADNSSAKIYIDGEEVKLTAYNIDGSNYFKLRDIAQAIDFAVTYDNQLKMLGINSSAAYE